MHAAMNGRANAIKALLECSASVNLPDRGGSTALMEAAHKG